MRQTDVPIGKSPDSYSTYSVVSGTITVVATVPIRTSFTLTAKSHPANTTSTVVFAVSSNSYTPFVNEVKSTALPFTVILSTKYPVFGVHVKRTIVPSANKSVALCGVYVVPSGAFTSVATEPSSVFADTPKIYAISAATFVGTG